MPVRTQLHRTRCLASEHIIICLSNGCPLADKSLLLRAVPRIFHRHVHRNGLNMTRNASFREIERKLAESLAQLEANRKTERLRDARECGHERKAQKESYLRTAADVVGILECA